jgi:hypothetical protein
MDLGARLWDHGPTFWRSFPLAEAGVARGIEITKIGYTLWNALGDPIVRYRARGCETRSRAATPAGT